MNVSITFLSSLWFNWCLSNHLLGLKLFYSEETAYCHAKQVQVKFINNMLASQITSKRQTCNLARLRLRDKAAESVHRVQYSRLFHTLAYYYFNTLCCLIKYSHLVMVCIKDLVVKQRLTHSR